jgi:hypothetical protein
MRPAHIVTLLRIREFGGRGCSDFTLRLLDLNRWEPRTAAFGRPADRLISIQGVQAVAYSFFRRSAVESANLRSYRG